MILSPLLALPVLAVMAAVWAAAYAKGRVDRRTVSRGLTSGMVFAAGLGAVAAAAALVFYRGDQPVLAVAAYAALVVAVPLLLLGLTVLPVGLLFGGGSDWARYGAWAAVVVIVVSLGLGYTAYRAFDNDGRTPSQGGTTSAPP